MGNNCFSLFKQWFSFNARNIVKLGKYIAQQISKNQDINIEHEVVLILGWYK